MSCGLALVLVSGLLLGCGAEGGALGDDVPHVSDVPDVVDDVALVLADVGPDILGGPCGGLPDGSPCDDGDPCTVAESCLAQLCAPGVPIYCDDGDGCTGGPDATRPGGACEGDVPIALGQLSAEGVWAPIGHDADVEVVHGPQGGIHVALSVRVVSDGLPATGHVSMLAQTHIDDTLVGEFITNKLPVEAVGDAHITPIMWVIFYGTLPTTYLGNPPAPTAATVCAWLELEGGAEGSSCQEVVLFDGPT